MRDLLTKLDPAPRIDDGAVILRGFCAEDARGLVREIDAIAARAPFRKMQTPGGGAMSVAMTGCGLGWVSDRRGYRYTPFDPMTETPWPAMPASFASLADRAARAGGFGPFAPDACLINRYGARAKMGLHQDKDERDFAAPIVSVSLGLPATFLWGGSKRGDATQKFTLQSGDVVVWGGPARLNYHGIATLKAGHDPLTGDARYNLTFRKAL